MEASKEAKHAKCAEDADGEVQRAESDEGERDNDGIEAAPAVVKEIAQPEGVEVCEQLDGESNREAEVQHIENVSKRVVFGLYLSLSDG